MANPENKQIPYESTQKDIRDAIESVATAIGGITHPDAEDIVYDNSVSGLSATDVQNALDEIVSDIPTVNNGTLTIQQNGTSIGSFSANTASNVTANIKTPTADKKTATTEFNTANGGLLSKCMIDLAPVQSGSGDPSPDNVRPISGHTEVDLDVKDGDNVTQHTYQVQIGSTVYGGYDEIVSGSGKGTLKGIDLGSLTFYYDAPIFLSNEQLTDADLPPSNQDTIDGLCECYKVVARSYIANNQIAVSRVGRVVICDSRYTDPTDIQNYVSGKKLVYKLATPTDITTTPQQIEALVGQNNLSTPLDGQSIETNGVEYKELFTFADVKEYVDKKIPDAPTTDGTYTLQAVVSGGVPTYSWV